jgi:hypothetical protein
MGAGRGRHPIAAEGAGVMAIIEITTWWCDECIPPVEHNDLLYRGRQFATRDTGEIVWQETPEQDAPGIETNARDVRIVTS